MNLPSISTSEGRKAWAFVAMVGGAMVFTVFAAYGVWVVTPKLGFSFWLALAAHAQIFLILSGLAALLIKRNIKVSKDGVEVEDQGSVD